MAAVRREAVAVTFEDVERLIYQAVHDFRRRYGGDVEDLKSQAYLLFMKAYERYDRRKGSFSTWCYEVVYLGLLQDLRRQLHRRSRVRVVNADVDRLARKRPARQASFDLRDFLDGLSDDARLVVKTVTGTSREYRSYLQMRGDELSTFFMRNALRDLLKDHGWDGARIRTAFTEVADALAK
jgi:hypothetical protein